MPIKKPGNRKILLTIFKNIRYLARQGLAFRGNGNEAEIKARVNGVSSQMGTFDFYFSTSLAQMLLRHTDNLSRTLQQEDMSAAEGQEVAAMVKQTLQAACTDMYSD